MMKNEPRIRLAQYALFIRKTDPAGKVWDLGETGKYGENGNPEGSGDSRKRMKMQAIAEHKEK